MYERIDIYTRMPCPRIAYAYTSSTRMSRTLADACRRFADDTGCNIESGAARGFWPGLFLFSDSLITFACLTLAKANDIG